MKFEKSTGKSAKKPHKRKKKTEGMSRRKPETLRSLIFSPNHMRKDSGGNNITVWVKTWDTEVPDIFTQTYQVCFGENLRH